MEIFFILILVLVVIWYVAKRKAVHTKIMREIFRIYRNGGDATVIDWIKPPLAEEFVRHCGGKWDRHGCIGSVRVRINGQRLLVVMVGNEFDNETLVSGDLC